MKKIRSIKKNYYDQLIKQTMPRERKGKVVRDKLKDKTINDISILFETKEEKQERKERGIMKELLRME